MPQGPTGILGRSAVLSRGAMRGRLLQSAPVSKALVAELRGRSRKEEVWGNRELKWVRRASSDNPSAGSRHPPSHLSAPECYVVGADSGCCAPDEGHSTEAGSHG